MSFRIVSTGSYVPEKILNNEELSHMVETNDEWITQRVGIKERHISVDEPTSELGYKAAQRALDAAGVTADQIDMIICASITAEYKSPNVACMIQKKLGATCPAMDINCACSAFVFALETAAGYFARGKVNRMLVVGAERLSATVDWTHRSTCVIFGDGAGAVLLEKGDNYLSSQLHSYGDNDIIRIPNYGGDSPFYKGPIEKPVINMNGQETFKFAVKSICKDIADVAADAGVRMEDISWVVPHQANSRIIDFAKKKLPIPGDRFYLNIERYGNTSSASIPIALDELNRKGCFKRGELLALCAFGGGLSSAACIIRW